MEFDSLVLIALVGAFISLAMGVAVVAALCMAGRTEEGEEGGPRSYGTGAMAEKREGKMTTDLQEFETAVRSAWEQFHGPIEELDNYIPAVPPAFWGGFRAGMEWERKQEAEK